jgi:hypothetical protein
MKNSRFGTEQPHQRMMGLFQSGTQAALKHVWFTHAYCTGYKVALVATRYSSKGIAYFSRRR